MTSVVDPAFFGKLDSCRVLAIVHDPDPAETVRLCRRAWALAIKLVEIPIRAEGDLALLTGAVAAGRSEGRIVGAGTIISADLVRQVADLGAAFTVGPGLDEGVAETSAQLGLPHLPGVATATEVQRALALGLRWQKVFPAQSLGTGWFSAMRQPFRQGKFVATGGITAANAGEFLEAGAAAVSLGSAFARSSSQEIRALTMWP